MEGPVHNNTPQNINLLNLGALAASAELRADSDSRMDLGASALHQATMRVNSLSLSEGPPLRKRNREDEDRSFRVDKMSEAPSNVPRSQAMMTPEEYLHQHQSQQSQQSGYGREDSLSMMYNYLMPQHSNSNGSTGSGSLMNMLASQDSTNQDLHVGTPTPPGQSSSQDKSMFSSFNMGDGQFPYKTGFVQGAPFSFVPPPAMQNGMAFHQNSGLSLPSQPSLNLGSQTSGLNLGQSNSGLNLSSQNSGGLSLSNPNILGLNINAMPGLGLNLGGGTVTMGMAGNPAVFQPGQFLSFNPMPRGQGFESLLGEVRPRYDQAPAGGPAFFQYGFPPAAPDSYGAGSSRRSPPGSTGSKSKKPGVSSAAAQKMKTMSSQAASASALAASNALSAEKYVSWSTEQENALTNAVEDMGTNDWEAIAARIPGGHRTGAQCLRHWENKLSPHIKRGQWSPDEDEALRKLVERASEQGLGLLDIPWEDIKPYIPGRTLKQVRERWRSNLDPGIVRGEWTQWEDEMIVKMRDEQGMGWASIARALKGRTEHSVKTRHRSMQRAKKRAWTEKEDRIILDMVQQGTDFATIAGELKNRTAASVEMRWKELGGGRA